MADFVAVLKKTIDGMGATTPTVREKVYDKARATVAARLAAMNPQPPQAVADRQKKILEDAIRQVEQDYSGALDDPFAELEHVFAPQAEPTPAAPSRAAETSWAANPPRAARSDTVLAGDPEAVEPDAPAEEYDDGESVEEEFDDRPVRRRSYGGLIAAVIALVVIAGGGYAVWLNADDFGTMIGLGGSDTVVTEPATTTGNSGTVETASGPAAGEVEPENPKFTQRLNADGTEVDDGPAGGEVTVGEGTSVAAVTQLPAAGETTTDALAPTAPGAETPPVAGTEAPAAAGTEAPPADAATPAPSAEPTTETAAAAPAPSGGVAVGQKAIFYEERTNVAEGSAENGGIVWSLIQQSPGGDLPAEPAIRAEATIPGKDIQLRMTISRNMDKTLPASHIIELIFLTPENFEGGGIENILRFTMKDSEQATGSPLIGIPAKIADGFFLVALNDTKAETEANLRLLEREKWIDVPLVYKSGRRALITMEKGIPGEQVFDEAIKAWQTADAATPG